MVRANDRQELCSLAVVRMPEVAARWRALTIDDKGGLKSVELQRRGNPEGREFHDAPFGRVEDKEGTSVDRTQSTANKSGEGAGE